jgi:hypothetical protein
VTHEPVNDSEFRHEFVLALVGLFFRIGFAAVGTAVNRWQRRRERKKAEELKTPQPTREDKPTT